MNERLTLADEFYIENEVVRKSDVFILDKEKCIALKNFLFNNGWISHEFHPIVHEILKDLNKYLGE